MTAAHDFRLLRFADGAAWRGWLEANHDRAAEAWVGLDRSGATAAPLTIDQAQEQALCFGWIDVKGMRVDASTFAVRFTPRRARSAWSIVNIQRIEKLIATGQMTPSGMAAVAQAKDNGEWSLGLRSADIATIPAELQSALRRKKGALLAYRALSPSRKRQILRAVFEAKTAETRRKRIQAVLDSL